MIICQECNRTLTAAEIIECWCLTCQQPPKVQPKIKRAA